MAQSRKLSLKREALTPIDLSAVVVGTYTGNPFCVLSIVQPCVHPTKYLDCVTAIIES